MSRRKVILIIVAITLLVTIIVAAFILTDSTPMKKESKTQQQTQQEEESRETVSSMEGDGATISSKDIKDREDVEELARKSIVNHLEKKYPENVNIFTTSTQWYYTEANNSDNILVFATVITKEGEHVKEMLVAEIENAYDEGEPSIKSIYPPDERYNIYE